MSDRKPLMPKATAVWLVDNTALTFDQIAAFCGLHTLEVKGIADGDVAQGIKGLDPVSTGQVSRQELDKAEQDETHVLTLLDSDKGLPEVKKKKARYTPTSRRNERPNAIFWLLRNHPELKDAQIIRLTGTTKPTLTQIRDRTHWNAPNLVAQDPVALGLCSQIDLDAEVLKAAKRVEKEAGGTESAAPAGGTLLPTAETTAEIIRPKPEEVATTVPQSETFAEGDGGAAAAERLATEAAEDARVFAQLKELSHAEEAPNAEAPAEANDAEAAQDGEDDGEQAAEQATDGGDDTPAPSNN